MSDSNINKVAEQVIESALNGGYTVTVSNGGSEPVLFSSTDKTEIMNSLFATGYDTLEVRLPDSEYYYDVTLRGGMIDDHGGTGGYLDFITPGLRTELDCLFKDSSLTDEEQQIRLGKVVTYLGYEKDGVSYSTDDGVLYSLKDDKLVERYSSDDGEHDYWVVYNASDLTVIDSSARQERETQNAIEDGMFKYDFERALDYMQQEGLSHFEDGANGTYGLEGGVVSLTRDGALIAAYKTNDLNVELSAEQVGANRAELATMSLVDQIDRGYPRPAHVSEEDWKAAEEAYFHQMTLENTPDEFLYPDRDDNYEHEDTEQHWTYYFTREEVAETYRDREAIAAELQEKGGKVLGEDGTIFTLRGDIVLWEQEQDGGFKGAFWTEDVRQEFSHAEVSDWQPSTTHVSDAVLDEVFEKHADDHMASVHGIEKGSIAPALTEEQTNALFAKEEKDDFEKTMEIAREIENSFPSQDPMYAEQNEMGEIQRQLRGEPWSPPTAAQAQGSDVGEDRSNVFQLSAATVASIEQAKAAKSAFDLSNMMASAGLPNSQQSEMTAPTDQAGQPSVPSFMKSRGPDFSTAPTKAPEKAAATATKLTPESRIIRLDERGDKQSLASVEAKKQGPDVAVERKAFTVSGKEIVSSYELTKDGKVIVTDFDGSKAEMTFAQAKRHEIETLAQMNRNALAALNMMRTDPAFTLRQGDATYSVQNGFFCQKLDNGQFKKEPLARTQERWNTRIREVEAMLPEQDRSRRFAAMAERASAAGQFTQVESKSQTMEQGMRP
jgi:hypothetical protein